jgi:hypothetical protein
MDGVREACKTSCIWALTGAFVGAAVTWAWNYYQYVVQTMEASATVDALLLQRIAVAKAPAASTLAKVGTVAPDPVLTLIA